MAEGGGELSPNTVKRNSLFGELRLKMGMPTESRDEDNRPRRRATRVVKLAGNQNATKPTRTIHLGWFHEGTSVRMRKGGGTRTLKIKKEATKSDIIKKGKDIFQVGLARIGDVDDLAFDVLDYCGTSMPENITIGEVHDSSHFTGYVRCYMSTSFGTSTVVGSTTPVPAHRSPTTTSTATATITAPSSTATSTVEGPTLSTQCLISDSQNTGDTAVLTAATHTEITGMHTSTASASTSTVTSPSSAPYPTDVIPWDIDNDMDASLSMNIPLNLDESGVVSFPRLGGTDMEAIDMLGYDLPNLPNSVNMIPDTLQDLIDTTGSDNNVKDVTIKITRVNIVEDMVRAFMAPDITNCDIKFQFISELGSDMSGVSRDAYTTFWQQFMASCADGEDMRVPAVNTKWQHSEWVAVGRILVKSFVDHKIMPLMLSKPFVIAMVFGEESVPPSVLREGLLAYVGSNDAKLITSAIENPDTISEDERDSLIEVFEGLGCRQLPPEGEEFRSYVLNVAHSKIIQEPKYIMDSMSEVSKDTLSVYLPDVEAINSLYDAKTPTYKKVAALLKVIPENKPEADALRFFQQYLRSQSPQGLAKVLHFLTGANVICVDKIDIEFTQIVGLARRPVAHTCGPVLQLPATYTSYRELRQEFDGILQGDKGFTMDIV